MRIHREIFYLLQNCLHFLFPSSSELKWDREKKVGSLTTSSLLYVPEEVGMGERGREGDRGGGGAQGEEVCLGLMVKKRVGVTG